MARSVVTPSEDDTRWTDDTDLRHTCTEHRSGYPFHLCPCGAISPIQPTASPQTP